MQISFAYVDPKPCIQVFLGFVDKDFKNQPAIILELSMALAAALYEKVSFCTLLDLFVYECLCINLYENIFFFNIFVCAIVNRFRL